MGDAGMDPGAGNRGEGENVWILRRCWITRFASSLSFLLRLLLLLPLLLSPPPPLLSAEEFSRGSLHMDLEFQLCFSSATPPPLFCFPRPCSFTLAFIPPSPRSRLPLSSSILFPSSFGRSFCRQRTQARRTAKIYPARDEKRPTTKRKKRETRRAKVKRAARHRSFVGSVPSHRNTYSLFPLPAVCAARPPPRWDK